MLDQLPEEVPQPTVTTSVSFSSNTNSTSLPLPTHLPPENDTEGNIEYKSTLVNPSASRLQHLSTQMKWRLQEGGGQALYEIGVGDDGALVGLSEEGMRMSLDTLERMAAEIGASVVIVSGGAVYKSSNFKMLKTSF